MTNYPPAYVYPQTPYQPPINRHEGLAITALVLGIIGCMFGLIPITFWIALPCGVLAVVFGFIGHRPLKGKFGVALGTIAIILGIIGVVIVNNAVTDFGNSLDPSSMSAVSITHPHPGWQHNPHNPHYVPLTRPTPTSTCTLVQTGTIGSLPRCV